MYKFKKGAKVQKNILSCKSALCIFMCDVNVGSWIGSFFSSILLSKIRPSKIPLLASHNPGTGEGRAGFAFQGGTRGLRASRCTRLAHL